MRGRALTLAAAVLLAGCRQDMHDQPKFEPYEKNAFFPDLRAGRPGVPGTVARGTLKDDLVLHTGKDGAAFVDTLPFPLDMATLRRGRERYEIYCTPCHGAGGKGDGIVVRRGFRQAASFHDPRLRAQPAGYFFDVITSGFGAMPDYAAQVDVRDRWAIVAYVRALQLSQNARVEDVPADKRALLSAPAAPAEGEGHPR